MKSNKKSSSRLLHESKKNKKDEFYTDLSVIEDEIKHHRKHFKGKTVYCNCDDPRISNFFRYFSYNFEYLDLKRLITTCYKNNQLDLFSTEESDQAIMLDYNGDKNGNRVPDVEEIGVKYLKQNGDFRNEECIDILKKSDIIVTNPPFSLFRQYIKQLMDYNKKFLIIGNINAVNYKEVFPFIQDNKVWLGPSIRSGDREFGVPDDYPLTAKGQRIDENGKKFVRVTGVRWFTNLSFKKRYEDLILYKKYTSEQYPKYDNYDAINVNKTKEIPMDYDGVMGVPITFLDKYNPKQFEILGLSQKAGFGLKSIKFYDDFKETRQDGTHTGSSGKKTNGNPVMKGKPKKGNFYINEDGETVYSLYGRIFIKKRKR